MDKRFGRENNFNLIWKSPRKIPILGSIWGGRYSLCNYANAFWQIYKSFAILHMLQNGAVYFVSISRARFHSLFPPFYLHYSIIRARCKGKSKLFFCISAKKYIFFAILLCITYAPFRSRVLHNEAG